MTEDFVLERQDKGDQDLFQSCGYPVIRFADNARLVHRLVYIMVHGDAPKELDHINNDKTDYSIGNLRPGTRSENLQHRRAETGNRSGYKGVSWDTKFNRWLGESYQGR
jgi:hypothetical protein